MSRPKTGHKAMIWAMIVNITFKEVQLKILPLQFIFRLSGTLGIYPMRKC